MQRNLKNKAATTENPKFDKVVEHKGHYKFKL